MQPSVRRRGPNDYHRHALQPHRPPVLERTGKFLPSISQQHGHFEQADRIGHFEFSLDVFSMRIDGQFANAELVSHFTGSIAKGKQAEHLFFPWCESLHFFGKIAELGWDAWQSPLRAGSIFQGTPHFKEQFAVKGQLLLERAILPAKVKQFAFELINSGGSV